MPRGVYDRSKAKARRKAAEASARPSKNLTFSAEFAEKFWELRDSASKGYPFELTNTQFFALLMERWEKTGRKSEGGGA